MTQDRSARPLSALAVNVLQAAANMLFVLLFLLLAVSSYQHFLASGTLRSFGVLAVNTLFAVLFLMRRPAKTESTSLANWLLAVGGTCLGMLMRPSEAADGIGVGAGLQVAGLALLALALLSLRRSFAIVPANRGIRDGGLYRIVRHPIYVSELIVLLGVVLANPTRANAAIWACECALQYARACAEERFLRADPAYQAYLSRVRFRLLPGIV